MLGSVANQEFVAALTEPRGQREKTPGLISMASLLLSPDSPAPEGTSAEDGGGGEDGEDEGPT